MMRRQNQDQQSRVFDELSALVFNLLRSSTPISFSEQIPIPATSVRRRLPEITPAGFASLLLGMSLSLMLCGSVTFFIGFLLMPWVLGLVMVFYVAGIVSAISMVGRSLLCYATAPPSSPRKEFPGNYSRIPCFVLFNPLRFLCSLFFCLFTLELHEIFKVYFLVFFGFSFFFSFSLYLFSV
ncbi:TRANSMEMBRANE PROTEIN [Salix purpurea]|uniref:TRANSMEMBRANE PROTEIN n=2 Tax=Salix TaxID=40685 RepID=A0A9Q0TJR6_SALPP|nr:TRANSMEMBRANE PROTEIN [Salix koriyanagi]KAJ6712999.1 TRANSMEMBRANE PROTEIN [Salix purpurea]